jgi:endonuclease/exonuclease/phosphatase family metal-dependent hydrolase
MPKSIIRRFSKTFVIVTNILAALFFLLGCFSSWFKPQFWWFTGFLNLASFYLLLILGCYLIFWLFVKPKLSLISLIAILVSINPIKNIIPFRFSTNFAIPKDTSSLRVMSWNVAQFNLLNFKKDSSIREKMLDLINAYDPDIACFQEMVCGDSLVDLNTAYYHKYSFYYLPDLVKQLHFPYHFYAYNVKEDYLRNQHFGIIIFSKYPIINKEMVSEYPHNYNSIFQYADIVKENDTLRVFNIHLQSLKFTPNNLRYIDKPSMKDEADFEKSKSLISKLKNGFLKRQLQADRIEEEMEKSPYPNIVCGDFNDVPNSYPYRTIGKGMKNAFVEKGSGIGRTFSGISPTLRIDNIFVDRRWEVQQFTRIQKKLSDHYPIIADIKKGD